MMNLVRRRSPRGYYRCAFTGYRPQKMPFGSDESDPRCIEPEGKRKIEGADHQGCHHHR